MVRTLRVPDQALFVVRGVRTTRRAACETDSRAACLYRVKEQ